MRLTPASQHRTPHDEGRAQDLSVETLIRHAHESLAACRVPVSATKVTRLCRLYARTVAPHGVAFAPWFVAQIDAIGGPSRELLTADLYRRISYRDKTGETAARNVDRVRQAVSA